MSTNSAITQRQFKPTIMQKDLALGKKVNCMTVLCSVICLCSFRLQISFDYIYTVITSI